MDVIAVVDVAATADVMDAAVDAIVERDVGALSDVGTDRPPPIDVVPAIDVFDAGAPDTGDATRDVAVIDVPPMLDAGTLFVCTAGTWDRDGDPMTPCVAWSTCNPGQYVVSTGSESADRRCTSCGPSTFSTADNASSCQPWQSCPAGTFIAVDGSLTRDHMCMPCPAGQYSDTPNQRSCRAHVPCAPGQQQTTAGTPQQSPVCAPCTAGNYCAGGSAPAIACTGNTSDADNNPATPCLFTCTPVPTSRCTAITAQTPCNRENACIWSSNACQVSACTTPCTQATCEAQARCTWEPTLGCRRVTCDNRWTRTECDAWPTQCTWDRSGDTAYCRTRNCIQHSSQTNCLSDPNNCIWDSGACRENRCQIRLAADCRSESACYWWDANPRLSQPARCVEETCRPLTTQSTCAVRTNCQWSPDPSPGVCGFDTCYSAGDCRVGVVAGALHTCVLRANGSLACWGDNSSGQVGAPVSAMETTPRTVAGLGPVRPAAPEQVLVESVAAGRAHTCAVLVTGAVACWGANESGQLGDGTTTSRFAPALVPGLTDAVSVTAGSAHTCARRANSAIVCWGANDSGQLGNGTFTPSLVPTSPTSGVSFLSVTAGQNHTCGVLPDGVWCWGSNPWSQTGSVANPQTTAFRVAIDGRRLALGRDHTCSAVGASGQVYCWGANGNRELGTNAVVSASRAPVSVFGGFTDFGLAAGFSHTCARVGGSLNCWGANDRGQLGNGTTAATGGSLPVQVINSMSSASAAYIAVAGGGAHTCALRKVMRGGGAIEVFCWGANDRGQLGIGSTTSQSTPVVVPMAL